MSEAPSPKRRQGFWLTAGEIIGALALVVAVLGYWEGHKQHAEETRRATSAAKAQAAFVVTGSADADGRRIVLHSMKSAQADMGHANADMSPVVIRKPDARFQILEGARPQSPHRASVRQPRIDRRQEQNDRPVQDLLDGLRGVE